MMAIDPDGFALEREDLHNWAYEYAYKDGRTNVSALIDDLEIPTIGVFNGHGGSERRSLLDALRGVRLVSGRLGVDPGQ